MLYVSRANESVIRLAAAIAQETNDSFSAAVAHALRRWVRYMEQTRPDAVKRAREKTGVHT